MTFIRDTQADALGRPPPPSTDIGDKVFGRVGCQQPFVVLRKLAPTLRALMYSRLLVEDPNTMLSTAPTLDFDGAL